MMLNARKKLVTLAVASAIGSGVMLSAPAQAVNVSQNNVGQVLLFPYYTVKNGFDTLFTVTNTSDKTAVFKIRFREALNSREVRDFNVVLSPYDHWGGVITKVGNGAVVRTWNEKTCTSPILPASTTASGAREIDFTNTLFTGTKADGASEDLSRVQEGYFEVILMGVSSDNVANSANVVAYNAKHVNGTPRDCTKVDNAFLNSGTIANMMPQAPGNANSQYGYTAPENVLKGHITYIDVATGKAIDAEPAAIESWRTGALNIIDVPSSLQPDLANGDAVSTVNLFSNGQVVARPGIVGSQNAVSMLLMADSVINEYATGSGAATSWVVTFPTKHHYADDPVNNTNYSATNGPDGAPPFKHRFRGDDDGTGKACDDVSLYVWNREEGTFQPGGTQFSPVSETPGAKLCYEANVIDFNGSSVFGGGVNRLGVDTSSIGTAGWAKLGLTNTGTLNSFTGLPVIGFAAIMRDAGGASVNYGSSIAHSYESGAN